MNDEFCISKTIVVGSNGGKETAYNLSIERLSTDLNDITIDEMIRLNNFLSEYIKMEGGRS